MAVVPQVSLGDFFANPTIDGWDVAFALISLIVAWLLGRLAQRGVLRLADRLDGLTPDLRALAGRITKYFVFVIGVGVALGFLGAPVQPLLAAAVIVGIVVVLAMRGVADNFAAGIVLQTRRPIHVDDEIETLGHTGIVRELNGRAVVIETPQGAFVHLPNSKVLDSPIVNHSARSAQRSEVEIRLSGSAMLDGVRTATAAASGVLADPAPSVLLTAVEPERVTAVVSYWHAPGSAAAVTATVIEAVAEQLRLNGQPTDISAKRT
ncbi:MAG TPA: mechanosensitive ion channel domain-containing protein [Acidimicrobiales bacterium]|nr:mechanosensitive ion channel domain-containing protein [Acidimicrobiales bacterium]